MDLWHKRKDKTRDAIRAAIERLKTGQGRHPRHIGIRVRLTKEAMAREAGRSSATLYRFPELLAEIDAAAGTSTIIQRRTASQQHRQKLLDTIAGLEQQNALLLGENLRLMRLLSAYDPTLGEAQVLDIDSQRERRRLERGAPEAS
jgi:hypothetical protein